MPVYEYACTECGERLEVRQSFTDDPLSECPTCSGRLRKVLSPVGVVFKGSGFYRTDARSGANGSSAKDAASATGKESSDSGSTTKSADGGSGGSGGSSKSAGSGETSGSSSASGSPTSSSPATAGAAG